MDEFPYPNRLKRQAVLDAVVRLHMVRARVCASRSAETRIERFPLGDDQLGEWLRAHLRGTKRELLAVTLGNYPDLASFLPVHEANKQMLDSGIAMLSIYDYPMTQSVPHIARILGESVDVPYLFGYGPVQLKIIDRRRVVLEGPSAVGEPRSLLFATDENLVSAALAYVGAVRATAVPARAANQNGPALTPRQHAIAALLAESRTDQQIADELAISVRTVRYEVAKVCDSLGVSSRFAAGMRYSPIMRGSQEPAPATDGP